MFSTWQTGIRKRQGMSSGRFTPRLEAFEERAVPATITWVGGSGDWNTAANWNTGTLPGPQDDAVIDRSGVTVTHSAGTHRINSLLTANGTFQLTGGTLDVGTTVRGNSSFQLRGGRLANATVAAGTTVTGTGSQIELDRITVAAGATFDLGTQTSFGEALVFNGLVIDGTANLGHASSSLRAAMYLRGTQSILGSGRIVTGLGGAYIYQNEAAGTLTVGPNLTFQGNLLDLKSEGVLINHAPLFVRTIYLGAERPWTNTGTITQAVFLRLYGPWTSTSEITITNGGRLELRGDYFVNRGTIRVTNVDTYLEGRFRRSDLGNFVRSGGTVVLFGTLDGRGESMEFNAGTGSWSGQSCTVLGGTFTFRDGTRFDPWNCVLDGVTFGGPVDWAAQGMGLRIRNGLTVNGQLLLGNALGTTSGRLHFEGPQTLVVTGGVVFGSSFNNAFDGGTGSFLTIPANTSIRGTNAEFRTAALINYGTILANAPGRGFIFNTTFLNAGTAGAENGGSVELAGSWQTSTPLRLTGSGQFTLGGNWNYPFPLMVTSGSLRLAGTWGLSELTVRDATATISHAGGRWGMSYLTAVNSTLNLGDGFHPYNIYSFTRTGGIVNIVGTVDNAGREFILNASTGSWNLLGGRIRGGTVRVSGGSRLIPTDNNFNLLDRVAVVGDLHLISPNSYLTVRNGLTLDGTIFLGSVSPARLVFEETQTLSSTRGGTIVMGEHCCNYIEVGFGPPTTLTFDSGITVRGKNGGILPIVNNSTFVNYGTIHADVPGGVIRIEATNWSSPGTLLATNGGGFAFQGNYTLTTPLSVGPGGQLILAGRWTNETEITATDARVWLGERDPWTNRGTITVNDCTVSLRGSVTTDGLGTITRKGGTVELAAFLDNIDRTLVLDEATGPWLFSGHIRGGTVKTREVALIVTGVEPSLTGVLFDGLLDASTTNNVRLRVFEGLSLNGTILLGNDSGTRTASLEFNASQTLGTQGGGVVVFGGGSNNRINVFGFESRLTIAPGVVLRGRNGSLNSTAGSFHNQGTIQADELGGTLTLNANNWTNSGTIQALNGGQVNALGTTTNYADGILTGGTWAVYGGSTLRVNGADVRTNAATIYLEGADSNFLRGSTSIDALADLTTNATGGILALNDGRRFTAIGSFLNEGQVVLGRRVRFTTPVMYEQTDGITELDGNGATLTATYGVSIAGGVLAGSGLIDADVGNAGRVMVGGFGRAGRLFINGYYYQTDTGALDLELGGVDAGIDYDQLFATGTAWLDGTLTVALLEGYTPQRDDRFQVLTFGERDGEFAQADLPDLGPDLLLEPQYGDQQLVLAVVPSEPGPGGLFWDAAAITLGWRPRRGKIVPEPLV